MRAVALVLTLGLFAGTAATANPLSEFDDFRSYPFLDKGYKAAAREEWPDVERLMRHILKNVPHHPEARRLLIQALAAQDKFEEALQESEGLDTRSLSANELTELRRALLERKQPSQAAVAEWLAHSDGQAREELWKAYSSVLAQKDGAQAAWRWLSGLPWSSDTALRLWRSTFAEQAAQWSWVISDLQSLASQLSVSSEEWLRLGQAYIHLNNEEALFTLLSNAPSHPHVNELRNAAIERAVARKDAVSALRWLHTLGTPEQLPPQRQAMMWELALQTANTQLVQRLAPYVGHSCVATAQWLYQQDRQRALAQLEQCVPQESPASWLEMVRRLQAVDLLLAHSLPAPWAEAHGLLLLQLLKAQGRDAQALAWVLHQPGDRFLRQRAELLQAAGRQHEAARAWQRLYQQTRQIQALEQASYLLVEIGDWETALQLLSQAFEEGASLPAPTWERLVMLHTRAPQSADVAKLTALLERAPKDVAIGPLLLHLAQAHQCAPVDQYADPASDDPLALRALGFCQIERAAGAAVVYYQRALALGDKDSERGLAYALYAAGDAAGAHEIWSQQPTYNLAPVERLAAARSALAANQPSIAEAHWQSIEKLDAEGWRLGAAIAAALGNADLALAREKEGLATQDATPAQFYAAAATALAYGDQPQSLQWLHEAVIRDPAQPRYGADYGLRLAASPSSEVRFTAIPYLRQAQQDYPVDFRYPEALGFRLAEASDNEPARAALRRAVDLLHPSLWVNGEDSKLLQSRQYALRRTHEALSRRTTLTFSGSWSPAGVASNNDQKVPGSAFQMAMWDQALGQEPVRNGRVLAAYGRVFTGSQSRNAWFDSLGFGLGLRYKPLATINLNLYGELYGQTSRTPNTLSGRKSALFSGQHTHDLLLRATASLFDQGEYRNDWRPAQNSWKERDLYLDAAWFVRSNQRQFLARYQQAAVFKLPVPGAHTLAPYAMAQWAHQAQMHDLRAALGVRWQWWLDEDRYNAYRDRLSIKLEYQHALSGTLYRRAGGWLFGVELSL